MDEASSVVFEIEKASACAINDGASNVCIIEESPIGAESSNAHAHSKLLKLPLHKVAMTRKGTTSTCM